MRRQADIRVILTSPPIAMAGLSEVQARATHRHIRVLRWPFAETERARIEDQTAGHVKLITCRAGSILGAGIVGSGAEELISLVSLAISKGMTAGDIASIMAPFPALSDAVRSAASMFRDDRVQTQFGRLLNEWRQLIERQMLEFRDVARGLAEKAQQVFRRPT
jgi:hypothetical protein